QGERAGEGVSVLAGADDHGVELAVMVEEGAEIGAAPRLGKFGGGALDGARIDVAESDDVLGADGAEVGAAAAADTDHGDVEPIAGALSAEKSGCRRQSAGPGRHE